MLVEGTYELDGNELKPVQHDSGYYVSLEFWELQVHKTQLTTELLKELLSAYASTIKVLRLENVQPLYVGVWMSGDVVYIYISTHINGYNEAVSLGKNNNQLAIFDCSNKVPVFLNGSDSIL